MFQEKLIEAIKNDDVDSALSVIRQHFLANTNEWTTSFVYYPDDKYLEYEVAKPSAGYKGLSEMPNMSKSEAVSQYAYSLFNYLKLDDDYLVVEDILKKHSFGSNNNILIIAGVIGFGLYLWRK